MSKSHKKRVGVVYSTDPNFNYEYNMEKDEESIPASQQNLKLFFDTKRKGKGMTIIENFRGPDAERKALAAELKNHCGCGGSVKDGEILIQGDQRQKIYDHLLAKSYKVKRKN